MLHVVNHSNEQFRVLYLSRMRYFDTPTQIITAKLVNAMCFCVFSSRNLFIQEISQ